MIRYRVRLRCETVANLAKLAMARVALCRSQSTVGAIVRDRQVPGPDPRIHGVTHARRALRDVWRESTLKHAFLILLCQLPSELAYPSGCGWRRQTRRYVNARAPDLPAISLPMHVRAWLERTLSNLVVGAPLAQLLDLLRPPALPKLVTPRKRRKPRVEALVAARSVVQFLLAAADEIRGPGSQRARRHWREGLAMRFSEEVAMQGLRRITRMAATQQCFGRGDFALPRVVNTHLHPLPVLPRPLVFPM
mmetsp:Transcript_102597/g.289906  ORF Transcript_102597/g.289906 Transcript_102597/m.289906 type:complete len:250 (+) Transcript_102597:923-1672(+)